MSFHFSCIHFSFYFFLNAFLPKISWGPRHGVGVRVIICGHGHRAKKWRTVGQKVTYSGPKCDVRWAEKWRTGQNATLECYTTEPIINMDKYYSKTISNVAFYETTLRTLESYGNYIFMNMDINICRITTLSFSLSHFMVVLEDLRLHDRRHYWRL